MSMISGAQSQLAFAITVTPALVVLGIVWAAVIGVIGGLLPALRAARIPVASALQSIV
jgi:putative ABC transport system permease protein